MKYRSRSPSQLSLMSRKPNFDVKIFKVSGPWNIGQGQRVKVHAWRVCQGQLLCKVSHLRLSLMSRKPNFDVKIFKDSGPWNIGQGYWVKVCAWRVCQGQLLCKVSDSQLSLMSRKLNFDVDVDGRTNGWTEIWTPISHPAISRCDKNNFTEPSPKLKIFLVVLTEEISEANTDSQNSVTIIMKF